MLNVISFDLGRVGARQIKWPLGFLWQAWTFIQPDKQPWMYRCAGLSFLRNAERLSGPRRANTWLRAYADSEAQISLCIRAVWSEPSLIRTVWSEPSLSAKSLATAECMVVCTCAGWSESAHFAHVRRYLFVWRGPYSEMWHCCRLFLINGNKIARCSKYHFH